jgi:uncharacterized protein
MKSLAIYVASTFAIVTWHEAFAASFDCRKARTAVEKAICEAPEISSLDEDMARLFSEWLKESTEKKNKIEKQKEWIRSRDSCGSIKDKDALRLCLRIAHTDRINEINAAISKSNKTSESDTTKIPKTQADIGNKNANTNSESKLHFIESYIQRSKSLIENVLNYTGTGNENGIEKRTSLNHGIKGEEVVGTGEFWISGFENNDKCIATKFQIRIVSLGGGRFLASRPDCERIAELMKMYPDTHREYRSGHWGCWEKTVQEVYMEKRTSLDIRSINMTAFELQTDKQYDRSTQRWYESKRLSDGRFSIPVAGSTSNSRLAKAWELAFQECPGRTTPF